jgi:hypothetical protein|tara:strand:+ start:516 stop:899 length:384 start_codon:yes stop_codon:yes gene_type:complete
MAKRVLRHARTFREVQNHSWPTGPTHSDGDLFVLVSRFEHDLLGPVVHLSISARNRRRLGWADLQDAKGRLGLGSHEAIEVYPRDEDVGDLGNIYHLYVLAASVSLGLDDTEFAQTGVSIVPRRTAP